MTPISQACRLLRDGKLVAFPTETVYGLGADATNAAAVQQIFAAKGRPSTNPVIVHIADIETAKRYAAAWPTAAEKLAAHFWPGPLTLVLPKKDTITSLVTAGRATVGLRVPNHPLALQLLREFNGAIAAPSANRSNHISATRAEHVRQELGDSVDLILDGGSCEIGIESTVLDLSNDRPIILRPGGVTREQIESLIGSVDLFAGSIQSDQAATSPGQQEKHYAPSTPTFRFARDQRTRVLHDLVNNTERCALVISGKLQSHPHIKVIEMPDDPPAYAATIYATLRELDSEKYARIIVEMPPDTPQWLAVCDRLQRATLPI